MTPLINGTSYSWANIRFNFFGIIVMGVTAISWSHKKEKKDIYATGPHPSERAYGNETYGAKMSLTMAQVELMRLAIPGEDKSFNSVAPFPIVVQFQVGNRITTKTLQMCEFTNDDFGGKQGDMGLQNEFDLIIAGVKHS